MRREIVRTCFAILLSSIAALAAVEGPELDVRAIPIGEWIDAGEKAEIPWKIDVRNPLLRMDQRMEVFYSVSISGKQLQSDSHDLFLVNRVSDPDGEWLTPFTIIRKQLDEGLPKQEEVRFNLRVLVKPGEYQLWIVLFDR